MPWSARSGPVPLQNDPRVNRPPLASPTWALRKITGLGGYNHGSAADAKRRILAFFDQYLRVGAAVSTGQLDG